MNKASLIALVGSVAVVGLVFLVVVWLVPPGAPRPAPDDIRGKWRIAQTSTCSDLHYIEITDSTLYGLPPESGGDRATFDARIDRVQDEPVLYVHIPGDPSDEIIEFQVDTRGGQLKFISAAWSKETIDKYGAQVDTAPVAPVLAAFQRLQPFTRCP